MYSVDNGQVKVMDSGSYIIRGEQHRNGYLWELVLEDIAVLTESAVDAPKRLNRRFSQSGQLNNSPGIYQIEIEGVRYLLSTDGAFDYTPYKFHTVEFPAME